MANVTRFDPLHSIVDDLFKGFFVRPVGYEPLSALEAPRITVDVAEKDGAYLVTAELPGVKKEDIRHLIPNPEGHGPRINIDELGGTEGTKWT